MNTTSFDELLNCLEATHGACESITKTYDPHEYVFGAAGYRSLIAVEGYPILPPVMTYRRGEEMRHYRSQAVITEMKVKARARRRLLQRVQKVVDSIEVSKVSSASEAATLGKTCSPEMAGANALTGDSGISSRNQQSVADNCIKEEALDTMAEVTDLSNEECEGTGELTMDTGAHIAELMEDIIRPTSKNSTTSDSQQELCNTVISKLSGIHESSDTLVKDSADTENTALEGERLTNTSLSETSGSEIGKRTDKKNEQESKQHEDKEVEGMTATLLSRVQLHGIGDDTPSISPVLQDDSLGCDPQTVIRKTGSKTEEKSLNDSFTALHIKEGNVSTIPCENEDVDKTDIQSLPTPGPTKTPDVSGIDFVQDDLVVSDICITCPVGEDTSEAPGSPKVVESTKIERPHSASQACEEKQTAEISACHTASTELGPYLGTSAVTTSILTTMPHVADLTLESISASILDGETQNGIEKKKVEISGNSSKDEDSSKSSNSSRRRHIRHASYTLDHPSPILVATHANHSTGPTVEDPNNTLISVEGGVRASTENLMAKPVQRKLEYDSEESYMSNKSDNPAIETETKEEHLHNYLRNLSEMPVSAVSSGTCGGETHTLHSYTGKIKETVKRNTASPQTYFGHLQIEKNVDTASPLETGGFDSMSLKNVTASHCHKTSTSNATSAGTISLEEQALQMQMVYFEQLKQRLVEQQKQQLAALLAQQQQQQQMLQHELLAQEQKLLQEVSFCASSVPTVEHSDEVNRTGESKQMDLAEQVLAATQVDPVVRGKPSASKSVTTSYSTENKSLDHMSQQMQIIPRFMNLNGASLPVQQTTCNSGLGNSTVTSPPTCESTHSVSYTSSRQQTTTSASSRSTLLADSVNKHTVINSALQQLQSPTCLNTKNKFARVTAAARGYLVRRLLRTARVQAIIHTIKDTAIFALKFQQETPIKKGVYSIQDKKLQDSIISQITAAMYEIHEIFFDISTKERMSIISQDRQLAKEKIFKADPVPGKKVLSSATQKAMERKKKAMLAEAAVISKKNSRPNTAPASTSPRVFKSESSDVIKRQYQQIMKKTFRPIQARMSPAKPTKQSFGNGTDRPKTAPGVSGSPKRAIAKVERGKSPKRLTAKNKRLSVQGQGKPARKSLYGGSTTVHVKNQKSFPVTKDKSTT